MQSTKQHQENELVKKIILHTLKILFHYKLQFNFLFSFKRVKNSQKLTN